MYKRYPTTYFDGDSVRVYFAMLEFMQECGFTLISGNDLNLFYGLARYVYVLQDPNTNHNVCLILHDSVENNVDPGDGSYVVPSGGYKIAMYVFDDYDNDLGIIEQNHIAKRARDKDELGNLNYEPLGVGFSYVEGADLICIYTNRSLRFIYVPIDCYTYSHIWGSSNAAPTYFLFYGNFTDYHTGYNEEIVCFLGVGTSRISYDKYYNPHLLTAMEVNDLASGVFCYPEASNVINDNFWFAWFDSRAIKNAPFDKIRGIPPACNTSFYYYSSSATSVDSTEIPAYRNLWKYQTAKFKTLMGSTVNNTSVVLPLIVYGLREPKILKTWSAIGETKLVNLVDISHMHNGEVVINNGIEEDYHKYFVSTAFQSGLEHKYLGFAFEISAKEPLLKKQSEDNLTVWLNDTYRNFDWIEIEFYICGVKPKWTYDRLNPLLESDAIFDLNSCMESHQCMVYGLKNENGSTTEYKLTFSKCIKIKSITGYRE